MSPARGRLRRTIEPHRGDCYSLRPPPQRGACNDDVTMAIRVKAVARAIEAILRPLFVPTIIASVLLAFLALTFAAARLAAYLLDQSSHRALLLTWAMTTALGIVLVRQLPRVLK